MSSKSIPARAKTGSLNYRKSLLKKLKHHHSLEIYLICVMIHHTLHTLRHFFNLTFYVTG